MEVGHWRILIKLVFFSVFGLDEERRWKGRGGLLGKWVLCSENFRPQSVNREFWVASQFLHFSSFVWKLTVVEIFGMVWLELKSLHAPYTAYHALYQISTKRANSIQLLISFVRQNFQNKYKPLLTNYY